jgi:hypothetical protein
MRKWTKEKCAKEAAQYRTRNEFKKNSNGAYQAAKRYGYLQEITQHMPAIADLWTKQRCAAEAKKYSRRTDFQLACGPAYNAAWREGWLDEITSHMKVKKQQWTKEEVAEEAKKHKNLTEFTKKSKGAYLAAYRGGYLDEIKEILGPTENFTSWTKEMCIEEARQHSTVNSLNKSKPGAYAAILRMGIQDEAFAHMEPVGSLVKRCVYRIIDKAKKQVYIGLTCNHRKRTHKRDREPVRLLREHGDFEKLTDYIDAVDAGAVEQTLIRVYRNKPGWTVVNSKDGGQLGCAKTWQELARQGSR